MRVLMIANMYPDERTLGEQRLQAGIFLKYQAEMVEKAGIKLLKVVKTTKSPFGYIRFFSESIFSTLFFDYSVIHAHYVPHSALIPSFLKIIRKKPLIVTFHGDDALIFPYKSAIHHALTSFVIKQSEHIIARSREMALALQKLGVPQEKITVIGAGVDTRKFYPIEKNQARLRIGITSNRTIVLYVGRLHELKGLKVLYECAKNMEFIDFFFIGTGNTMSSFPNCHFVDEKRHDDIPMWMSAADVFVLPSFSEGLPNVVMEASSCGLPVIVTNRGGSPELVKDGLTGYVVEAGNVKELEDRLRILLTNEELRKMMGRNGREYMKNTYDREKVLGSLIDIYRKYA